MGSGVYLDARAAIESLVGRVAKDDDDLLPAKKKPPAPTKGKSGGKGSSSSSSSSRPSLQMLRIMLGTRTVGILLGGFVTLVGMMSVVGLVTDNFLARLVVGLLVVLGLPALLADRVLKRTKIGGGLGTVVDVFAIVLLGIAMVLVAADVVSKPLLRREGDRYARSGSILMARVVYYLAGVSPIFPHEKAGAAKTAASGSATASASASGGR
jgi:hypothetical protein